MASGSCCETPSGIRLRAARLNFEAPSFSLGIDTEPFRSIPSFDEFQGNSSGRGEEDRNSLRLSPPNDEVLENCSGRGQEDNKSCQTVEDVVVNDSEDDSEDFQISASQQQRHFKRLKRGPSSAGKEPVKGVRGLSRGTDISARRLSKDPSEFCTELHNGKCDLSGKTNTSAHRKRKDLTIFGTQLYKEPLPFVKDFKNQVPEGLKGAETEFINSRQNCVLSGSGDRVLSSTFDHRSGQKRLEPEPSLGSGVIAQCSRDFWSTEVSKFGSQRENGITEGALHFNRESLSSSQIDRTNPFVNIQPSSRGNLDVEKDDIEEFSDDALFGCGSRTQRPRRRSLRPQISGSSPILLSSSPETSEKPVLHIPRAEFAPKAPLRLSQPTRPTTSERPISEEDPFLIDEFVSGSGWRRTKPDLSKHAQTPQHLNNSTSESQRAKSVPNLFKTSKRDLFKDTNLKSFYTETPARRDIVGPSQALRNAEGNETDEDRIQAFLRQRFPHFKPVDALLVDGGLDNEPVYIDYRRQFADARDSTQLQSGKTSMGTGTRWSPVRSINGAFSASPPSIPAQRRNLGKKMVKPKNQPKKSNPGRASSSGGRNSRPGKLGPGGSGEGKWRTVHGSRVYIVGNQKQQRAYPAYKKRSGNSSNKKSKKRQSTKSK